MPVKILNVTEVRQNFSNLVQTLDDPIYVTVYGKPRAVMLSYDGYESLLKHIATQQDSRNRTDKREIAEALFSIALSDVPEPEVIEEEIHLALGG